MQRCPQGHYYDPARYSRCSACGISDLDVQPTRGCVLRTNNSQRFAILQQRTKMLIVERVQP